MKTCRHNKSDDNMTNQHGEIQLDPSQYSKGDKGTLVTNPSYHSTLEVEVALQKDEYEEMGIGDQPIYEDTF